MKLPKIPTDSDLSEAALEFALEKSHNKKEEPFELCVSPCLVNEGRKLSWKYKNCTLTLDTELPSDAWYITGKWFGMFSPGA